MYYNSYELYHHGIKGQKWGVRRFQNADGTLTRAGQLRLDKKQAKRELASANATFRRRQFANDYTFGYDSAARKEAAEAANISNKAYRKYVKTANAFKYEKAKEKGASDEKLAKIAKKSAKQEAVLDAQESVSKAINNAYAQTSTGRKVATDLLNIKGLGRFTAKTPIAALESVGYTKRGARALTILLGETGAKSKAYSTATKRAKKEFERNYDASLSNRKEDEDKN